MSLEHGSKVVLKDCLDVRRGEKVLIVTDDLKVDIGRALYEGARDLGAEALMIVMQPRKISGEEPPAPVSKAMEEADVVICPTESSLTHTQAKINAVKNGARVATMPGITPEMFAQGAITADYQEVEKLTLKITDLLTKGETARIVKNGYVLTLSMRGRNGIASTGIYNKPGMSGNLPSGEAYIAPVEGTAQGEMMIDGSMVGIGKLEEPLYVKIENGNLVEVKGKNADAVQILLENERNSNVGELGIGTNSKAQLCGIILEDEKVYGTVHIAFGTNTSFGGTVKADCHLDGVILKPDLFIDDVLVVRDGKILI
ncbi:aminopeptidase [Desulfosporosinus burensis]